MTIFERDPLANGPRVLSLALPVSVSLFVRGYWNVYFKASVDIRWKCATCV